MDKYRLVMPPTLFAMLAAPFWSFAKLVLYHDRYAALAGYCGGIMGYVLYDLTHYFLHHRKFVKILARSWAILLIYTVCRLTTVN